MQFHVVRGLYSGFNGTDVTLLHSNCRQDQWQCDNLQCISKDSLCDGYKQCSDGSDELKRECEKTGKVAIKSQENIEEI